MKILDQYDQTYKTYKEYIERNSGELIVSPVKDLKAQTLLGESGDIFAFVAVSSDDVFSKAIDISALRASNINPEETDFDMVRLSEDERDVILDRSISKVSDQIIDFLAAYAKTLHTPLQITSLLDDTNDNNIADEGEDIEDHVVILLRFPATWPPYKISHLDTLFKDILSTGILLEYWKIKGFLQFAEIEQLTMENHYIDLKSIITKRKIPIRRKANFFH